VEKLEDREATNDNMAHVLCMLGNDGYRHTFGIRNSYCFSTATIKECRRLSVTLNVHCLSCYDSESVCLLCGRS
jgi:hypothetical protein